MKQENAMNQNEKTGNALLRISRMETYMDEVANALRQGLPLNTSELQKKIHCLKDYMDSGLWLQDYEMDERGELPHDLKRGVLSQDALYDLLTAIENPEA